MMLVMYVMHVVLMVLMMFTMLMGRMCRMLSPLVALGWREVSMVLHKARLVMLLMMAALPVLLMILLMPLTPRLFVMPMLAVVLLVFMVSARFVLPWWLDMPRVVVFILYTSIFVSVGTMATMTGLSRGRIQRHFGEERLGIERLLTS
jgi:hypothetical protein